MAEIGTRGRPAMGNHQLEGGKRGELNRAQRGKKKNLPCVEF